jgi:CRISPR/Cas system Type II protein with McrA/HNH and RuvC-like nuclease domain
MASLNSIYIKKETLKTLYQTLEKKGDKGIEITISINEETNNYGQNLSAFVSQSKEQRLAKNPRFYVGNGKCFWTDGKIQIADTQPQAEETFNIDNDDDGLPF